jgi:hypothetical protein
MKTWESLTKKVKEGDKVVFHVGENTAFGDWGYESQEEMDKVLAHDGQTATVDVVAIDDGDPASEIIDGPFYVDITFEDGFELAAVDGYNLTSMENAEVGTRLNVRDRAPVGPGITTPHEAPPSARFTKAGRRPSPHGVLPAAYSAIPAAPVAHDTIPAIGSESGDLQDWVTDWAMENGSAVEIWGDVEIWRKIKELVDTGAEIKTADTMELKDQMVGQGYELLADEDNIDSYDAILFKPGVAAHDFIPAMGPESIAKQAKALVNTVLERARGLFEKRGEWHSRGTSRGAMKDEKTFKKTDTADSKRRHAAEVKKLRQFANKNK